MKQEELNKIIMNDWELEGYREEVFKLKLTAKHALSVGKWKYDSESGVDLRRYSYNEGRLLASGLSLQLSTWTKLYNEILLLYKDECFSSYGAKNEKEYEKGVDIDPNFGLRTEIFKADHMNYFCINMYRKSNNRATRVMIGRYSPVGILLRFDTIPDFLTKCQDTNLVDTVEEIFEGERPTDPKTDRKVY